MSLPLNIIFVEPPFQQWDLDYIGAIHPTYSVQHKWILTWTKYFTKWIEALPSRKETDLIVI